MTRQDKMELQDILGDYLSARKNYLHSRVHAWTQLAADCWLKRDDELSCTISGSKLRKLASLEKAWQQAGADLLLSCGGANSNHLPALAQIAKESALPCRFWLWGQKRSGPGNQALLRMFVKEAELVWLERDQWPQVSDRLQAAAVDFEKQGRKPFLVYEGAKQEEAIWGAMSLAVDVARNQQELGLCWRRIFVDSGTGMTAIGLYCGLALMQLRTELHVILIAGKQSEFEADLLAYRNLLARHGLSWSDEAAPKLYFHRPPTARSFGSTNQQVFGLIKELALTSGVLLDPIYTAKSALTVRALLQSQAIAGGPNLLIHSGGAWTNQSFWPKLLGDQ